MTWNNRLIQYDGYVGLHEVFYDDKGNIESWTEDKLWKADSKKDMIGQLELAVKDLKKRTIIKESELPK